MDKQLYAYYSTHKVKGPSNYTYVSGSDLCKFYSRPVDIKTKPNDIIEVESETEEVVTSPQCDEKVSKIFISTATQTDYRESEAQTDPWDPPFIVRKISKDPEVLYLKDLTYGNGLPATHLEVEHILGNRRCRKLGDALDNARNDEVFLKKKQLICNQVLNEWNYKISRHSDKQIEKLKKMELALVQELTKHSEKQERLLKNIWTQKQARMAKVNTELQKRLRKEIKILEQQSKHEAERFDVKSQKTKIAAEERSCGDRNKEDLNDEIDYLLSKYYMNPKGLSKIIDWLERTKSDLYNKIPLAKPTQRNKMEKLTEKAYQELLKKKQTKMPPKLYREDYDKEESIASSVKGEVEFEILELPEEGVDLVTVWQQVLRGRAYQKQMLELIEKHKDVLEVLLS